MEHKTGLHQLRSAEGLSAQILVRQGKVVHTHLNKREEPVDAEYIYLLLTWNAGEFEFVTCVVEGDDRVDVSTTHLLMEGARLMDESMDAAQGKPITIPPINVAKEQTTKPNTNTNSSTDDSW